jgi:hypothetical protein
VAVNCAVPDVPVELLELLLLEPQPATASGTVTRTRQNAKLSRVLIDSSVGFGIYNREHIPPSDLPLPLAFTTLSEVTVLATPACLTTTS